MLYIRLRYFCYLLRRLSRDHPMLYEGVDDCDGSHSDFYYYHHPLSITITISVSPRSYGITIESKSVRLFSECQMYEEKNRIKSSIWTIILSLQALSRNGSHGIYSLDLFFLLVLYIRRPGGKGKGSQNPRV